MRLFFEALIFSIIYALNKSHHLIRFNNNFITMTNPEGKTEVIHWDNLEMVSIHIEMISIFPLRGWSLTTRKTLEIPSGFCHFPVGANGEKKLLVEMQKKLRGFNQSVYKKARKSKKNKEKFVLWKRGMIHQEKFLESINKHFAFLMDDFGFSVTESQYYTVFPHCEAAFKNKSRYIEISWLLQGSLSLSISRILNTGMPAIYERDENVFYISELVNYHEPQNNPKKLLPKIDFDNPDLHKLDEGISTYAQLLRKFGADILSGHKWFISKTRELILELPDKSP